MILTLIRGLSLAVKFRFEHRGFAVMINGTVGEKRLDHPEHDAFFAEADRLRIPVAVHFSLEFPGVTDLFPHFFPTRVLAGVFPVMAGLTRPSGHL